MPVSGLVEGGMNMKQITHFGHYSIYSQYGSSIIHKGLLTRCPKRVPSIRRISMLLGSIERHKGEIRVALDDFRGKTLLNIRYFYQNKDGAFIPTKKGVALTSNELDSLVGFVMRAKEFLENGRLIPGRE